jgi:RNA polymerase sigma-70 factor (sigma-E family)
MTRVGQWADKGVEMRDDEGFAAYVEARGQHLVRVAYLLTGDHQLAQDLVQGVLSRALLSWDRLAKLDDVDAYLRRAVVNARTSWWRRVSRHESSAEVLPVAVAPAPSEDRVALVGELARLPYNQRAVLVLRYFEDLPDAQIADILNCAEATVRSHARRGLAALRVTVVEESDA